MTHQYFSSIIYNFKTQSVYNKCVQVSLSSDLYVVLDVPMDVYFKCNYGTGEFFSFLWTERVKMIL